MKAWILLKNGLSLQGQAHGVPGTFTGEIVFNTGMTGYQEIATDPSYGGQVVVLTYPLIGNYGICPSASESDRPKIQGLIVKEAEDQPSHWQNEQSLADWLLEHSLLMVSQVDTRYLTRSIRQEGAMPCLITTEMPGEKHWQQLEKYRFPQDIVRQVSRKKPSLQGQKNTGLRVALLDLGLKESILQELLTRNCRVHIYPWNTPAKTLLSDNPDVVLLSNGPGDPRDLDSVIAETKKLLGQKPLWGICLGYQVLALALGARAYKLKFGHRGSNHPVQHLPSGKVLVSSQNHGYAIETESLPEEITATWKNVNDETLEGFICPEKNIQAVQFHPEAGPGPRDGSLLFDQWIKEMKPHA